jgi:hypothetical protein
MAKPEVENISKDKGKHLSEDDDSCVNSLKMDKVPWRHGERFSKRRR